MTGPDPRKPHIDALRAHAVRLREDDIASLFAQEADRAASLSFEAAGLSLDLSKQRIDAPALKALLALAAAADVAGARDAMFAGASINHTEDRAVLHTALRDSSGTAPHADEIAATRATMRALSDAVISGARCGHSGKRFTDVVNIGIGGSHLGPQLACDALRYENARGPEVHFLANVDGGEFDRIMRSLDPETTLFIVASKSFRTVETRLNATSARRWLTAAAGSDDVTRHHFLAVSANVDRAIEFGIDARNVFPMWDWVGGRYSMWSAIGLPVALRYGMDVFTDLLAGAERMDRHFADAPPSCNLPLLLALCGWWNSCCLGAGSYAVVPYDDRLRALPAYLQQLEMESNGKRVTRAGEIVDGDTAPVTWGDLGTNAQHAFFQLLHQGTRDIPVDFILSLRHPAGLRDHHDLLVANCFAQAEALMCGNSARPAAGEPVDAHRAVPGNRPNSMILLEQLDPGTLGALIALYEHKTFVQSVLWDINAFDQWGVELGKQLADDIVSECRGDTAALRHDASTATLIARYLAAREPGA